MLVIIGSFVSILWPTVSVLSAAFCPTWGKDTELAREYELDIDAEYIPLNIYTPKVNYRDVDVQVGISGCSGYHETFVFRSAQSLHPCYKSHPPRNMSLLQTHITPRGYSLEHFCFEAAMPSSATEF